MKTHTSRVAWTMIVLALTAVQSPAQSIYEPYTFTTLAGNAGYGSADGMGSDARFNQPSAVAVDSAGNVYVADTYNGTIRKVTSAGVVTTLADETGSAARFNYPRGVAVDSAGNVYVADTINNRIRKVTPAGVVTTLAGRTATGIAARFTDPTGVAVDSAGNVYVADPNNNTIRKVTPTGLVTTLAGSGLPGGQGSANGTGSAAQFNGVSDVAVDTAGNVYVADSFNNTIRKVTPAGVVTTLAGLAGIYGSADGTGSAAQFNQPSGVAVDSAGNVYVADTDNHAIRRVTPTGVVTTLAGVGSDGRFNDPRGVAVDSTGNVYVADSQNGTIRKVTPAGVVTALADQTGRAVRFNYPSGVAVDSAGNVYVADTYNNRIRKVTPAGVVTTLAGLAGSFGSVDGIGSAARFNQPSGLAVDSAGNVYVADYVNGTIRKVTPAGAVTTLAGLGGSAVAVDSAGNVYVADYDNGTIRKMTPAGVVTTLADETGSAARFNYPRGVAVDSAANVYVADTGNHTIRKMTPAGVVTTLAGLPGIYGSDDGTRSAARFNQPSGVAVDNTGNIYVADSFNAMIRKVTPAGVLTTLASGFNSPTGVAVDSAGNAYVTDTGNDTIGQVTPAGVVTTLASGFNSPSGVAVDNAGNVYVADTGNHTIRKMTLAREVTTLAGLGEFDNNGNSCCVGSEDGTGSAAQFNQPSGVAVDSAGNVYVADSRNSIIWKVTPTGEVTTLAGDATIKDQFGNPVGGYADGTGSAARFNYPRGVAVDSTGNVYVADTQNGTIRKVTSTGVVTTLADETGSAARFNYPRGVAVDSAGNVYVADGYAIRKVTSEGVVTTLAGLLGGSADGTGSDARFNYPYGVAVDNAGNVYVADEYNATIRKVTPAGVVTTLAGLPGRPGSADGTGSAARFGIGYHGFTYTRFGPAGVAVDSAGNIYVADSGNHTIRKGYPAPRILNSGPGFGFNGGQFGFNLTGPVGRLVVVEASSELVSWLPIWTNTFAGALNFNDPQSGASSHRFYRAHLP